MVEDVLDLYRKEQCEQIDAVIVRLKSGADGAPAYQDLIDGASGMSGYEGREEDVIRAAVARLLFHKDVGTDLLSKPHGEMAGLVACELYDMHAAPAAVNASDTNVLEGIPYPGDGSIGPADRVQPRSIKPGDIRDGGSQKEPVR
jgi:hypothetical protein